MDGWSSDPLPNYGHQLAMMKNTRVEFFLTWVQHPFRKGNIDCDWRFDPAPVILSAIFFIPALAALPAELCVNEWPILFRNILRTKIWVSNYL
jgi:hypothetical protein